MDTTKRAPGAMHGTWKLVRPDGVIYRGNSPMRALQAESRARVPADVAMARIMAAADEPDFAERHVALGAAHGAKNVDELVDKLRAQLEAAQADAKRAHQDFRIQNDGIVRLQEALGWYADEARALAKHAASGAHTQAVLASVTVLSLDGGKRADAVLNMQEEGAPPAC
jgi:hypothetical protein